MAYIYRLELLIEVRDEAALYKAAMAQLAIDGLDEPEAREHLIEDGDINIACCIQVLGDPGISWPGTSILESSCE